MILILKIRSNIVYCIFFLQVNIAFSRLEEGYDNAIKDYYKKQVSQLSTLISLLLGDLNKQDRQKIMTICTIDVHSRDVVSKLIQMKVENASTFQWVRFRTKGRFGLDAYTLSLLITSFQFYYHNITFRYTAEFLGQVEKL